MALQRGKDIRDIAIKGDEREVLFTSGSKFIVVEAPTTGPDGVTRVVIEEL